MSITITKGSAGKGIWCDRRSPLGNPFHLATEKQRGAVCDAYQKYFDLVVKQGYSPIEAARLVGVHARLPQSPQWKTRDRGQFLAELDRLSTILAAEGHLTLKCWCINVEIKSSADLEQKKRCHCLSIARHLLGVRSIAEQLKLEV